jgi:phytoene desaturase
MNYADMVLGTWYPQGGMIKIVEGMVNLAQSLGVTIQYNAEVQKIEVADKKVKQLLLTDGRRIVTDVVVGGADYHHLEQHLLDQPHRQYDKQYWSTRVLAPSSLIFYLGLKGRLKNLVHHNLFFDADFRQHSEEIYTTKKWPTDPLFYMSVPLVTDTGIAPEGHENVFILIPIAPGLTDTPEMRQHYYTRVLSRAEQLTGQSIIDRVVYKKSYCINDFISDYHAYKGNAYGLANTLMQTAFMKPKMKSTKVENLYYTGQLTVPGPGVPPALISGQIVAREVMKKYA